MPDVLTGESLVLQNILQDPTVEIVAHLSKSTIDWDGRVDPATQLVECDFLGYVPVKLENWVCLQSDDPDAGEALSQPIMFQSWDNVVPQLATAVYLTLKKGAGQAKVFKIFPIRPAFGFEVGERPYTCRVRMNSHADIVVV